jgi:chromosome segregation ATPase
LNFGQLFAVGGPVAGAAAIIGYLFNAYLSKRKDDRQGVRLERESESGIVETTAKALEIVRQQMEVLRRDLATLQGEKDSLATRVKEQESRIEDLSDLLDAARAEVAAYRNRYGELQG